MCKRAFHLIIHNDGNQTRTTADTFGLVWFGRFSDDGNHINVIRGEMGHNEELRMKTILWTDDDH